MTKLETDPCEICGEDAESLFSGSSEVIFQRCPKCGDIKFTRSAASMMRSRRRNPDSVRLVLGFIRDQNRSGAVPTINSDMLETIIARPLPSVLERAERLLLEEHADKHGLSLDDIDVGFEIRSMKVIRRE